MKSFTNRVPISHWAEEDRPREKLLIKGKGQLSKAELIAILIGSGSREESAVQLAKTVLNSVQNNLAELARLTVTDLLTIKGIGEARALTIIAALELGKRRLSEEVLTKKKIRSSEDVFHYLFPDLSDKHYEEFWILLLDRANQVIGKKNISEGGISGTVADPKKIFRLALDYKASAIIMAHNHPSNNLKPSNNDIELTKKLRSAGKLLDMEVLDHLIFGHDSYYSFADEGMM
ncbi:MAG: DNA repair protein RadC [bacterium]